MVNGPNITAIILAAGQSQRMGKKNKLLLQINKKTMIKHVVDAVKLSHIMNIIIVTGHEDKNIKKCLNDMDIKFIHNDSYKTGISSSLKKGITTLPDQCDGVLICLGDMPLVSHNDINKIIAAFKIDIIHDIYIPVFNGKSGNPVLIGKRLFNKIKNLSGDMGARQLFKDNKDLIYQIEMPNDNILKDFDTEQAFNDI